MCCHRNGCESHGGSHDGLACKSRSGASVERRWRLFVPLVLNVFATCRSWHWGTSQSDFEKLLFSHPFCMMAWLIEFNCMIGSFCFC